MNPVKFTFKKAERLTRKKLITQLFKSKDSGNRIIHYPLIFVWHFCELPTTFPAQVLIVIQKKYSKKATRRNRIKRLLREVYRKNKHRLYNILDKKGVQAAFLLLYIGQEEADYWQINKSFDKIVQDFAQYCGISH